MIINYHKIYADKTGKQIVKCAKYIFIHVHKKEEEQNSIFILYTQTYILYKSMNTLIVFEEEGKHQ